MYLAVHSERRMETVNIYKPNANDPLIHQLSPFNLVTIFIPVDKNVAPHGTSTGYMAGSHA